jgi:hypothetical protein
MADYLQRAQLAEHKGFQQRVQVAMIVTAVNVASEPESGDARRDGLRAALATNVLNDPDGYVRRFAWATVTNAVVAEAGLNAPDGDLEFLMSSFWDGMAGV